MPLKLFREKYGGGLHNVLLEDISRRLEAVQTGKLTSATAQRARRGRTPAPGPATVQRTTRKMAAAATAPTAAVRYV